MTKMSYSEQLRHPNWQRKRLEVMEAANFNCEDCGDANTTLNVHHQRYVKGRLAWEYEIDELQCLCQPCHAKHHEQRDLLDLLLMNGFDRKPQAIGLLAGYCCAHLELGDELEIDAKRVAGDEFLAGAVAGLLRPRGSIGWPEIAAAIRSFCDPKSSGSVFNPNEEHLLRLMESSSESEADQSPDEK